MTNAESFPLALGKPSSIWSFRPVDQKDLEPLCAGCWADKNPDEARHALEQALRLGSQGRGIAIVALDGPGGPIIGFGMLTIWTICAEISDLVVAEASRGHGVGTALIQHLCAQARHYKVECVEIGAALANPRALALYRRLGFQDYRLLNIKIANKYETVQYLKLRLL